MFRELTLTGFGTRYSVLVNAIRATRAGRFEYEIEAEATYHLLRNGVQGNGYPAIVGSGPNVNIWHYNDNGKALQDGELVVMDYGGSLDYMVIAVEPIVEDASKQLHIRVEDSVLITDGDPVILTSGVPKEMNELLALVRQGRER